VLSAALLIYFGLAGFSAVIVAYILLSVINNSVSN